MINDAAQQLANRVSFTDSLKTHEQAVVLADALHLPRPETPPNVRLRQSIVQEREERREEREERRAARRGSVGASSAARRNSCSFERRNSCCQDPTMPSEYNASMNGARGGRRGSVTADDFMEGSSLEGMGASFAETAAAHAEAEKELDDLLDQEMEEMGLGMPESLRSTPTPDRQRRGPQANESHTSEDEENLVREELKASGLNMSGFARRSNDQDEFAISPLPTR